MTAVLQSRISRPLLALILLLISPWHLDAYRVGDAIDTEIWKAKDSSGQEAPMRNQMALFGMDSATEFPDVTERFSISFEEGFRVLPWINLRNGKGEYLEKVVVTFIYSRSGGGEIHSISSRAVYNKKYVMNSPIKVEYKWIEEEAVDLSGGAFVMFLSVFIVSLYFMFDLCGLCDNGDDVSEYGHSPAPELGNYGNAMDMDPLTALSRSAPKYE